MLDESRSSISSRVCSSNNRIGFQPSLAHAGVGLAGYYSLAFDNYVFIFCISYEVEIKYVYWHSVKF